MKYFTIIFLLIVVGCTNYSATNHSSTKDTTVTKDTASAETELIDVTNEELSINEKKEIDYFWKLFSNALLSNDTSVIIANTNFPFLGSVYDTSDDISVDIDNPLLLKRYYGYVYPSWAIDSLSVNGYQLDLGRERLNHVIEFSVSVFYNSIEVDTNYNDTFNLESAVFWHFKKVNGKYLFVRFDAAG